MNLRKLLAAIVNEETIKRIGQELGKKLHVAVDILIAWAIQYAIQWMSGKPDDIVVIGAPGSPGSDITSYVILASVVTCRGIAKGFFRS